MSDSSLLFAYGSLVNDKTWDMPKRVRPVLLTGWVRQWRHCVDTPFGSVCGLTIEPKAESQIYGLGLSVGSTYWEELDAREIGYTRVSVKGCSGLEAVELHAYVASPTARKWASEAYPILQSYIDCLLDGYFRRFALDGMRAFIASTSGWTLPVRDDRERPRYPRAVVLEPGFLSLIDSELSNARERERASFATNN